MQARRASQQRLWYTLRTRFLAMFVSVYVCILAYAGWVIQQPQGTFTSAQHAMRISPVLVSPALAYIVYQAMALVFKILMKHTDKKIRACHAKTEKILNGLKDAMRYDRTHALLSKYDPEYKDALQDFKHGSVNGDDPRQMGAGMPAKMSLPKKVTAVAASTVGGAGMRLSGALAQLWSVTADTMIGDDPVLLNSLRVAETQAQVLEHENVELKRKIERYEEQFGLLYDVSLEDDDGDDEPHPAICDEEHIEEDIEHVVQEHEEHIVEAHEEEEESHEEEEEEPVVEEPPRRRSRRIRR